MSTSERHRGMRSVQSRKERKRKKEKTKRRETRKEERKKGRKKERKKKEREKERTPIRLLYSIACVALHAEKVENRFLSFVCRQKEK